MTTTNQPAKITLYWLEVSRSHRILWLLEELGVPYELKTFKRGKDMLADPKLKDIHPLGKSPVVTIEAPGAEKPLVLAESGAIVEYLCGYYGKWLIPQRYLPGKEDQVGGETASWIRYRYFMHYAEGSIMPMMLIALIVSNIKNSPVPFFIRPITNGISNKITTMFLAPNFKTHYAFLESQLEESPDAGSFLCGKELTGADILMEFPLTAGGSRSGMTKEDYPRINAYLDQMHEREAYKRAVKKIEETEGTFKSNI